MILSTHTFKKEDKKMTKNRLFKKVIAVGVAAAMVMGMGVSSFAGTSMSVSKAKSLALKNAGLTKTQVKYLEGEYDDGKYEVEFTKKSNGAEYSYEYSKGGSLLEKGVEYKVKKKTGSSDLIGKTAAKNKVKKFGGFKSSTLKNAKVYKDKDDGQYVYEVKFHTTKWRYEYDVQAKTGKILEWSKTKR